MGYAIRVVCSPAVGAGFRLAGVTPTEVEDPADGVRRIRSALHEPNLGVLLVEEPIYGALSEADRRALGRQPLPIIVPFPGPSWAIREEGPEAFISELLRQAIGYRVRVG
jgi:vacuolar-type H+-ATPase subunit F/Vma7